VSDAGDGPGRRELRAMDREQLVRLGDERDGVRVVASTPRLPPGDARARRRAQRHVAAWFALSALFAAAFVAAWVVWPGDYVAPGQPGHVLYLLQTPVLGLTFGLAVVALGVGVTMHVKRFVPDEIAVQRWELGPSDRLNRRTAAARLSQAGADTGLAELGLARRALLVALGAVGVTAGVLALGTFVRNPWKGRAQAALWVTPWARTGGETVYLRRALAVTGDVERVRPEDMDPGGLLTVYPFRESERGDEERRRQVDEAADAPAMLIRFRADRPVTQQRPGYNYGQFAAYSKICTHLGCPASLYDEETGVSLCPCHQSGFDMTDGAKVVFGPAVRPLPQLPITVSADGYFVATGDFAGPVGPSFWSVYAGS
jgi:quinol---cytochrome c reductase iron-sulfur subunit